MEHPPTTSGCATEKKYSNLDWPFAIKAVIAATR